VIRADSYARACTLRRGSAESLVWGSGESSSGCGSEDGEDDEPPVPSGSAAAAAGDEACAPADPYGAGPAPPAQGGPCGGEEAAASAASASPRPRSQEGAPSAPCALAGWRRPASPEIQPAPESEADARSKPVPCNASQAGPAEARAAPSRPDIAPPRSRRRGPAFGGGFNPVWAIAAALAAVAAGCAAAAAALHPRRL
jgi:hypothetical protein